MVHVFTASCTQAVDTGKIEAALQWLPSRIIERSECFRFIEDANRHLLGNILLANGLNKLLNAQLTLHDLQYNEFGKPFLPAKISFNISHAGNYVLCAISKDHQVGIDVEEIRNIEMEHFLNCFTANEWLFIERSNDPVEAFYYFWTRKEAVIKADGRGLNIPLTEIDVINNDVVIGASTWHLNRLMVAPGYIAHLATSAVVEKDQVVREIL